VCGYTARAIFIHLSRKVNLISNISLKFLSEESVSEQRENLGELWKLGIIF